MVAKIKTGASFAGCTSYAYGKDQAKVIAYEGVIPDNAKIAAKCFEMQAQLNANVSKPVGHIAISFKPEDKHLLTDEFMAQLAKEYMEKMGIRDTQYVIVRHHNTPNPHFHLIYNRVDNHGNCISDSNMKIQNIRACKELKQKYGLTFGKGKSQTRTERLRSTEKRRYEMAHDVKSILKTSSTWNTFISNLKAKGITAEIKLRRGTNIPQGISFTRNGLTFKGSSLDRSLSFPKIDQELTGGQNILQQTHEHSQSPAENLASLAGDLAIEMLSSGSGTDMKDKEQNQQKKGPRL